MRFYSRFLSYIYFLLFVFIVFPGSAIPEDCLNKINSISSGDLKELLFAVDGNFSEKEKKALNKQQIIKDIYAKLKNAGLKARIIEKKELIKNNTFIKVRIHSILLERQVYLCSAAIIQRLPSQKECTVKKHSNVTTLAKFVPSLINDLMDQLIRDIK
ncbi:MAG: hypothetical protein JRF40_14460 [Deltaproteobacteria bacterium]|nr:hypothetical protein [Deltaproteobacteria bacterium]